MHWFQASDLDPKPLSMALLSVCWLSTMGGCHPHLPRPGLTISNPWKSGRMEAVGLASLSLSKTGTLTTKTTLAIGTTSVTIATSASRKANALVWDSQPN